MSWKLVKLKFLNSFEAMYCVPPRSLFKVAILSFHLKTQAIFVIDRLIS